MQSYLHGQWSERGWWYFYLYGLLLKLPLGTWLLVFLATWLTFLPGGRDVYWRDEMLVFVPLIIILSFVSSQTGISIHFRYVLPIFPFLFIWASKAALAFAWGRQPSAQLGTSPAVGERSEGIEYTIPTSGASRELKNAEVWTRRLPSPRLVLSTMTVAGLVWAISSSLWYYPHSLAYFNELAGGPVNGHAQLLDSSLDWGQDLLYLKEWYDGHPEARPFYLATYGSVDPRIAGMGIEYAQPPAGPSEPGQVTDVDNRTLGPFPGWYAIDVYYLHGDESTATANRGAPASMHRNPLNLTYFRRFRPVDRVGYSMRVFHITPEEASRVRRDLQLE
jgi:hypothetical protein